MLQSDTIDCGYVCCVIVTEWMKGVHERLPFSFGECIGAKADAARRQWRETLQEDGFR